MHQQARIVTLGVAEHIQGGVELFLGCNRLENQAQLTILLIEID
jgi:hypothetical protein